MKRLFLSLVFIFTFKVSSHAQNIITGDCSPVVSGNTAQNITLTINCQQGVDAGTIAHLTKLIEDQGNRLEARLQDIEYYLAKRREGAAKVSAFQSWYNSGSSGLSRGALNSTARRAERAIVNGQFDLADQIFADAGWNPFPVESSYPCNVEGIDAECFPGGGFRYID